MHYRTKPSPLNSPLPKLGPPVAIKRRCYNLDMREFDMKNYRNRWEAVKAVEEKELREASLIQRWKKLNSIARLAFGLGLSPEPDQRELPPLK